MMQLKGPGVTGTATLDGSADMHLRTQREMSTLMHNGCRKRNLGMSRLADQGTQDAGAAGLHTSEFNRHAAMKFTPWITAMAVCGQGILGVYREPPQL